ncbi:MAG: hypothetical protein RLZZ26_123, partial [Candidatus Parcubacteria bacterium]
EVVAEALSLLGAEGSPFVVERPADAMHGDYTVNAALAAAKQLKKNPRKLAEELAGKIKDALGEAERVEVAGPGFVNITLAREAVTFAVAEADAQKGEWGKGSDSGKVMIEYTSPNLFKPLHIGNLVGNILGESIARLLEANGATVTRINYPSDIGLTVAKGVWGLKTHNLNPEDIAELGKAYVLGNTAYEEGADEEKKEIEEINRSLYAGSDEALSALRAAGISTSRRHLDELCRALGTTFDQVYFESQSAPRGKALVEAHIEDGIFEKSDGAVVYKGEKRGLHTRVFVSSQGLPTYEAKDVGLFDLKSSANPDFTRSITITGSEQKEYFKVIFAAIADVFPERVAGKELLHISNGFLRLTTGKMSSRKGNVITGESLLEEIKTRVGEIMKERVVEGAEEVAEQVAIGAIKYMVLRQSPGSDIIFDAEKSLSLEGDSGPYLQYALVRAKKILAYGGESTGGTEEPAEPYLIERLLLHYPEVTARAARELAPNLLLTYLTEIAGAWNGFYNNEQILGSPEEAYKQRVARAFANTMTNGLALLGIPTPEKM